MLAPPAPPPAPAAGPVTLAVVNARVWTGTPRRPWADAVVARGDRLALVGGSAEARKLAAASPGARIVDARGLLLLPGPADAVEAALRAAADGDAAVAGAIAGAVPSAAALAGAGLGTLAAGGPAGFVLVDRAPAPAPTGDPARGTTRAPAAALAGVGVVVLEVVAGRVVRELGHTSGPAAGAG